MTGAEDTWLRRSARRFTLGTGPLKRGSDRLQEAGRVLVVLAVLAAPLVAVAAATTVTDRLTAVAEEQAAERSRTDAVLVEDAPAASREPGYDSFTPPRTASAAATWLAPDGTVREGRVPAPSGSPAGSSVPVWVDLGGDLVPPPLTTHDVSGAAGAIGAGVLVAVPAAAGALYGLLCAALDAHRQRRWAQGWAAVGPGWAERLL
ncbi:hypothetical protein ACI797_15925 [Geodermatophilus sp. SYSU D00691]